jgi:hypothetical protein
MTCLTEAEIQAVADHEAGEPARAHAEECASCHARVSEQLRRLAAVTGLLGPPSAMPTPLVQRVEQALRVAPHPDPALRGATRLRADSGRRASFWRPALAASLAAAAVLVVMLVIPGLDGPGTVSASEVLAQSLAQLSRSATGVELREYELILDGVPKEVMPDQENGTYRIQQIIDHTSPGRYRMSTYGPDGTLLSAISEDPALHRRTSLVRLEGLVYRFEFDVAEAPQLSLTDVERLHNEATVAVMQASGEKSLRVLDGARGKSYLIEIPRVSPPTQAPLWDLHEARVLIDAADYRIRELSVRGMFLKRPYSISYTLTRRGIRPASEVAREEFEVPEETGAVVLRGAGTQNPMRDALAVTLRELAEARAEH